MDLIAGMIVNGFIGLAAFALAALSRPIWVPLVVVGLGGVILGAIGYAWATTPCNSDAAGCGMSRGFEAILLMLIAVPLASGGAAAVGWRVVAGRDAGMRARLKAMAASALVPIFAAAIFF